MLTGNRAFAKTFLFQIETNIQRSMLMNRMFFAFAVFLSGNCASNSFVEVTLSILVESGSYAPNNIPLKSRY